MIAKGLGEADFIARDTFVDLGLEAQDFFGQLQAAGLAQQDALRLVSPLLQEIINEHQRSGIAIDANTQALVDQADAMGIVSLEGTGLINTLQTGFQGVIDTIARGFGMQAPDVFGRTALAGVNAANQIGGAFSTATSGASRQIDSLWSSWRRLRDQAAAGIGTPQIKATFGIGGYTGAGGDDEVAGYVHKNEFVFDAASTRAAGGAEALEAFRNALRGGSRPTLPAQASPVAVEAVAGNPQAPTTIIIEIGGSRFVAHINDLIRGKEIRVRESDLERG
jgi:hypothetical protein